MRVIEPRHHFKAKKTVKSSGGKKILALAVLFMAATAGYIYFGQNVELKAPGAANQSVEQQPTQDRPKKLKTLTSQEFTQLYSSFSYPNTQPLQEKPYITGNETADNRIRQLAEDRGYKLSAVPVSSIIKIGEPGLDDHDLIQPLAMIAWEDLKQAAKTADIPLQVTSAYRSIESQRVLFMNRLSAAGITVYGIADGYSDAAVDTVLSQAAPPGYSRHHTGFTLDFACDGVGLHHFMSTACYDWLSNNNFENAKKFGFVPSYPEDTKGLGPEPEPWEFIWVGTSSLYE